MSEKEQQEVQNNPGPKTMLDEVAFTIDELYKAIQHINYISGTVKGMDWSVFAKLLSAKNLSSMAKSVDLKQISELLQSPLVRQLLTDPELLALFLPELAQQPQQNRSPYQQHSGTMSPWGIPNQGQHRPQHWQSQRPQHQPGQRPGHQQSQKSPQQQETAGEQVRYYGHGRPLIQLHRPMQGRYSYASRANTRRGTTSAYRR